jgi:hypothetical protein
MSGNTSLFYNRLPINELPLVDLLAEKHLFFDVPEDWTVIITDVKNSTKAAEEGRHQTVNLVATGSIVAVLNIAHKKNITIPFFFGGDGATFIIPPILFSDAIIALQQHQQNVVNSFQLNIRVGYIGVSEIYRNNHQLRISKLRSSPLLFIPVVLGNGLFYAEKCIKAETYMPDKMQEKQDTELDMSGMHCRWDKIKPPSNEKEVISLLALSKNNDEQAKAFSKIMSAIDEIFGDAAIRKPISVQNLRMMASLQKIGDEMKNRFGGKNISYLLKTWLTTIIGKFYFKTKKGKQYLYKLVELSDTLVIDGKINTVISGTKEQRLRLATALDKLEANNEIVYGLHISKASVMSCYVRNLDEDHIHFVDGDDGGYTKAASILKKKIKDM